ncbi:PREDICTED: probable LRR receptor-like serine/threonine-protein kinase At1g06840 isoform X3 [Lupinus angustifolius]|nr:PREDICTED: probable LRR receptor-like serine/threonine-protein kinase At1g06840 isoform X3 [Lupinus angustifolius]
MVQLVISVSLFTFTDVSISRDLRPIMYSFHCYGYGISFNLSICFFLQNTVMPGLRIHGYALAVLFCFIILVAASQRIHPSEGNALIEIKKSLIDPKGNLRNWNKGDPCVSNWTGVWCFDKVGDDGYFHVQELYFMTLNLSGSLAPQLGQLSHLEILNFMWNNLTGTIPKEIGNLTSLTLLLLNGNNLSGTLPDELSNLSNLSRLQVDENQLSGPIPESFANLINVIHLHINNNSFSGQIPPNLSKLPNLMHLLGDNNNLSGYLPPEFSTLKNLRILQLDNNNFSGTGIPSTYANLSMLVKLSLRNCGLQGAIPDFNSIPELSYLDLSRNLFIGHIPSNKLSDNMTTIDLSNNYLNGSIPQSFSYLPHLQKLSLENNNLSGFIHASIWQNITFSMNSKLLIDLRNNSLLDVSGSLNPPANVTLRLSGNPICKNSNMQNIGEYCELEEHVSKEQANSTLVCPVQACPMDNFYEYAPSSPVPCFCAAPLRIGYRLKSPSFSYFPPYRTYFQSYITQSLNIAFYQLSIYTHAWEEGPRINMYLKIFPKYNDSHSSVFNESEVRRIEGIFTSWKFPRTDFFGPYELLNFTLLGPYEHLINDSERSKVSKGVLVAVILAAVAFVLAICAIILLLISRRRIKYFHKLPNKSSSISIKIDGLKAFTFKELAHATNKFNSTNKVGRGGYGIVYKGILSDETFVAVKRAEEDSLQGQKEFLTEIELLSRLHHRNLVSLIGYCNEAGEQMLVYEFMPNGTLRDWISDKSEKKESLSFGMRLQIAKGAAKGILYLHTEANPPIFHRDIKASNILLDSNFIAKVADFGLSRLAPYLDDEGDFPKHVSTVVKGTPGYLDPEYLLTHKLTDKCDVYSLGIVYLELLTGMQPISHGKNIVREVNVARESGMIYSITDKKMGFYPSECLDKFLSLALSCCQDNPELRPSMLDVVRELEDIIAMLPETYYTCIFSDITTDNSGKVAPSSSSLASASSNVTREDQQQYMSSYVLGSDLVSGVVPTIVPR